MSKTTISDDRFSNALAQGAPEGMDSSSDFDRPNQPDAAPADNASMAERVGETITLTVNGEPRRIPAGLTLPAVLEALGYRPQLVVVEFNGTILPRQRWAEQSVGETDVLEVVTIVGGGS
jgi:sulfur carrier protein